ncbi:MAG TPA: hypothetical protein VKB45_04000, partial [Gemmatimonadales bacterium]|nr:hypothetical protein [Gemmatimonadales bacterium]
FRALAVAGEGPLPQKLSRFADAAREAVALGHAVREPAAFAQALRHASEVLTAATTSDDATMAAGLDQAETQLGALSIRVPGPPAPAPTPAIAEAPESTFATFLKEVTDAVEAPAPAPEFVPIESLAPEPEPEPEPAPPPPPPPPQPVATPAPEPPRVRIVRPHRPLMPALTLMERSETPAETPDIVGSWITYQRMVASGVGPPSLDVLMGHAPEVVSAADELPVVDIKTLQYGGAAALARVQELRAVARRTPQADLPALFEEVCDLVDLAFEPGA